MKTLVHIGYHKTASTLLQNVFSEHSGMYLVPREEFWPRFLQPGSLEFNKDELKVWLEQRKFEMRAGQTHLVISEEELSGNIHTGGNGGYVAKEAADRLHAVMPDAEIIICVRNQFDLIESCYRHYVNEGGTFPVKRYLFDTYDRSFRFPLFSFAHFEFDRLVGYYSKLFTRVHVFRYEDLCVDSRSAVRHLLEQFGLDWIESLDLLAGKRVNQRMSRVSVFIARRLNRFYGSDPINRRAFCDSRAVRNFSNRLTRRLDRIQWIRGFDRNHTFLTPEIRGYISQRFADSNSRLEAMTGLNLRDFGYPVRQREESEYRRAS